MDFTKIRTLLKDFVTDNTSPEEAEKIAKLNAEIDSAEAEAVKFAEKHEELRQKYVKAVMNSTFKDEPKDEKEEPQGKTLEQCIAEEQAKMKGA